MPETMRKEKREKIVARARLCLQKADHADSENREKAQDDIRFAFSGNTNDQWEDYAWRNRADRPRLAYNRIEPAIDQIVGEQRQNRGTIKLRAMQDDDAETTETLEGLIRNIEAQSDAANCYDKAYEYSVGGGIGAWQIVPQYKGDKSFDQELCIKRIYNPFSVYWDPSAQEETRSDADWCLVCDWMSEDAFDLKYPGKKPVDVADDAEWYRRDDAVRVADFWERVPKTRTLVERSDGVMQYLDEIADVVDELEDMGITIVRQREVKSHVIRWSKVSGADVLEGPIEYSWQCIPVIPVFGKLYNIDGEQVYKGLTRNAKDGQRSFNYTMSATLEAAALAPKNPYLVSAKQIKGWERYWKQAHREPRIYLPYTPDEKVPGAKPSREVSPGIPGELLQLVQIEAENIKSVTGYHDPSLGAASNEQSGIAILQRKQEGDTGSYQYPDNLRKAIAHTGKCLVDMIPTIYDTERVERILGEDGKEKFVTINESVTDDESGEVTVSRDLGQGRYDVTVSTGPAYQTQRNEASQRLIDLSGASPEILGVAADIIVKGLDIPDSEELVKRLRRLMIQSGRIEPGDDPEEQALVDQPPDPVAQQQAQLLLRAMAAQVAETETDTAVKQAELGSIPLERLETFAKAMQDLVEARAKAQEADVAMTAPGLPGNYSQ